MISSLENSRQNNAMDQPRQLVLASTSRYRRELLERLGLRFETAGPDGDESALPGEAAPETALRLSVLKARSVAPRFADATERALSTDRWHRAKAGLWASRAITPM